MVEPLKKQSWTNKGMQVRSKYWNDRKKETGRDAFEAFMAKPRHESPMKSRWRVEDETRETRPGRNWNPDPSERRSRSPIRRGGFPNRSRGRRQGDRAPYRSQRPRDLSRDSRISSGPRFSLSPKRHFNPQKSHPRRIRPELERPGPSREQPPSRSFKRRRTQSPSPARSIRYTDRRRSRSRERYDSRDRRPILDRAISPRISSPARSSRPASRGGPSDIDSYILSRRRRDLSPSPRKDRRQQSPHPSSRSPPPRRAPPSQPSGETRELSPYSARALKTRSTAVDTTTKPSNKSEITSKPPSIIDDIDQNSMDGHHPMRGNYGSHNQMVNNGPQRPFVDTRPPYHGSPPMATPNSSYRGSPQSGSPYHNRGGWSGQQNLQPQHSQFQGGSPPFRHNNFATSPPTQAPSGPNQYYQNQQQYYNNHNPQTFSQPPFRGNHNSFRGGHQQHTSDRRFSGSGPAPPQTISHRGRGGHYNNLQWNAPGSKRGGFQNPNLHSNHSSPAHTSPSTTHGAPPEINDLPSQDEAFRMAKEAQQAEARYPKNDKSVKDDEQRDGSKFSFAFKNKNSQNNSSKPSQELTSKQRAPPTRPGEGRQFPPNKPRAFERKEERFHQQANNRRHDEGFDRKLPHRNDNVHQAQNYPDRPHPHAGSPPVKRFKQEPKPKPKLLPEFAASESIYYRKPGNESVVGAGTYGKVFKGIHIYTKGMVALKKIRMEGERDGFPITAVREIKLLQHLRHKHVVSLQEVMVEKNECFMVFEYLSHDLTGLINHPMFKLSAAHKKDLAKQMFDGLEFLHRRGVLHRDIKAANILVSNRGQLKYADFGLARFYTKSRQLDYTNRVITIWYRPPELLLGETQYGPAVDVWSAACVFVEMFTKKAIFPGEGGELSQLEKVYNILGTPTRAEWPGVIDLPWFELMQPAERRKRVFESAFKEVFTPKALELVQWMFKYDPTKRPTADEVLNHSYFTEEEPAPKQPIELEDVQGDWHEFESKAHRRENDRREKERKKEEYMREREKRKAREAGLLEPGAETKRPKQAEKETSMSNSDAQKSEMKNLTEVPPAPERDIPGVGGDSVGEESEGEGSARMSMS